MKFTAFVIVASLLFPGVNGAVSDSEPEDFPVVVESPIEGEENEKIIDAVIPPDETLVEEPEGEVAAPSAFVNEMRQILSSIGAPLSFVDVYEAPVVCGMSAAIGCASYGKIGFASRLSGYSYAWKKYVAAHEYAHIVQLYQWSALQSNNTYKNVFKSDIEHLADCMANSIGVASINAKSCNSSQLAFSRDVWNYKIDPTGNPSYKPIKLGTISITGDPVVGGTVKASAVRSGTPIGTVTTTYQWVINGTVVGTSSSYKIKTADAGKTLRVSITAKDNKTTVTKSSSNIPIYNATVSRFGGKDRYETNVLVNNTYASKGAPVFIATGTGYADALSVAPAVVKTGGSLFLSPKNGLPSSTIREINNLKPSIVYFIGGPSVVPVMKFNSPTERISGVDRYETSEKIMMKFFPSFEKVFIATGANYPDALSAGGLAGRLDAPLLLVRDKLSNSSIRALKDSGFTEAIILGGTSVVKPSVETELKSQLKVKTIRLSGDNRYGTNKAINDYSLKNSSGLSVIFLATGNNYPDALSIAAPSSQGVLMLSNGKCVPNGSGFISKFSRIVVAGGPSVVPTVREC